MHAFARVVKKSLIIKNVVDFDNYDNLVITQQFYENKYTVIVIIAQMHYMCFQSSLQTGAISQELKPLKTQLTNLKKESFSV